MADQNPNKITKYRRPLNINIGMVIFAVIFIYIVICVFMYFTSKHIVWYEVQAGSFLQIILMRPLLSGMKQL